MTLLTATTNTLLKRKYLAAGIACLLSGGISLSAQAQTAPDTGQLLQQMQPDLVEPHPERPGVEVQSLALPETKAGGEQVRITGLAFSGNQAFSDAQLAEHARHYLDQPLDMAGLQGLVNHLSQYYRQQGYPFARAFLPEQTLKPGGTLEITVVEGRYGTISTDGPEEVAQGAKRFLQPLSPGDAIYTPKLERQLLILEDQPGITVTPVISPGSEPGSGDLSVDVATTPRFTGQIGVDNHGNRFSGENRLRATATANRLLTLGDQLEITGLYTNEDLWLGHINYQIPLGVTGLRAHLGYVHTDYNLRAPFDGSTGDAHITTAGISYPLIRSQQRNLSIKTTYQHKRLTDDRLNGLLREKRRSDAVTFALPFDQRDSAGGGGITFGQLSATPGSLRADQDFSTQGGFFRTNLQLARLQNLPRSFSLFARLNAQWADSMLGSSEAITLGGAHGVRAYPSGEGIGSRGGTLQLELRYHSQQIQPYVFYDTGRIIGFEDNPARHIAGAGIGLRLDYQNMHFDVSSAWRARGGDAQSDDHQRNPRIWLSAHYTL